MKSTPAEYREAGEHIQNGLDLQRELEAAIARFAVDHAALLRRACRVHDDTHDLLPVAESALLGHVLIATYRRNGRRQCDLLCKSVLDAYSGAEAQMKASKGTVQ